MFLALFAGFTMVSCDFLDVVPAEKASDKDAFSSPKAAERFLYSCYGYIPQINMVQTCLDFSGDEIISPFTQESYVKFAEGVYTSGNLIMSYWNDLFLGIRQCYLLKKNITSVPRIDQATIDSYVAQADFLIAYFHMLLIKCYGPVVLVKELPVWILPKIIYWDVPLMMSVYSGLVICLMMLPEGCLQPGPVRNMDLQPVWLQKLLKPDYCFMQLLLCLMVIQKWQD